MSNVTVSSLREAGIPKELWARAKAICNSPPYRIKRAPYKALGGPFNGEIVYLDDGKTGPIRILNQVGQYSRNAPATPCSNGGYIPGSIKWGVL
jgi:hypothetical protein